jgi:UDP-glucose 4-epimerase
MLKVFLIAKNLLIRKLLYGNYNKGNKNKECGCMHVLVTGGAGFIGSHIVEHHLAKGDNVYVVDDLSTGSQQNVDDFIKHPNFRFVNADILTWSELEKTVAWADRIYHMAALVGVYRVLAEPVRVLAINIAGCERLLRCAAASSWRPHIIIASTSEVYGPGNHPELNEELPLIVHSGAKNRWNYAISKIADESFGLAYARKEGLKVTLARFFNTIGPRQTGRYGMVVPRFINQALTQEPITVYGSGEQTRSFCDVRDTIVALDLLASNPVSVGEIVNVGNNYEISIKNLAELVCKLACSSSKIQLIPYKQAYGEEYDDIMHRKPDLTKFYKLTNFKHQWNLEKSVNDLIAKYRHGENNKSYRTLES